MARRPSLFHALVQAQRASERQQAAQQRAAARDARAAVQAHRAYERTKLADEKQRAREDARLYVESRADDVASLNEDVQKAVQALENLLAETLAIDDFLDLDRLKRPPEMPTFDAHGLAVPEAAPALQTYLPRQLSLIEKLWPGAKEKHALAIANGQRRYAAALAAHAQREATRETRLREARARFEKQVAIARRKAAEQYAEIDRFKRDFTAGLPQAVVDYFTLALEASTYPDGFPQHAKLAYVPESHQLVVEYDLPSLDVVPAVSAYKYVKARDEVTETKRPAGQTKALYAKVVAQVALRTLHELFEADRSGHLETVVFNGYVDSIDKATGRPARPCLVTLRTTRDIFEHLDLGRVDPAACLRSLNASVSKSPAELVPVRPVLEFSMVDPRFVEETDVLTGLDQRSNLMELTPGEFEALITNLFEKMGLETRLTQASRDGGVDCVAYDPRPIFGGKVVIQAKRYKHTVGVSAVRDLYGTMQNEGASKGILVTTSGYGKASFEFAQGKPLELLDGSNLLYLLAEHAKIEAKIEPPETWQDPLPDG